MFCVGGVVVVVVDKIATLIVEIDAVVVAVENRILFTNFFTFFTFTVQFCIATVGGVVSVGLTNGKLAAHRISFGHNFGPQDFRWSQWQSGFLCHFSRQSPVIGHQSRREEVVKVRQEILRGRNKFRPYTL